MSNTNRLALENDVYCGVCGNHPEGTCDACGQQEPPDPIFYFAHVRLASGLELFQSYESPLGRTLGLIGLRGYADVLAQGEGTKADLEPRAAAVRDAMQLQLAKGTV
jgi:hypothetical protein